MGIFGKIILNEIKASKDGKVQEVKDDEDKTDSTSYSMDDANTEDNPATATTDTEDNTDAPTDSTSEDEVPNYNMNDANTDEGDIPDGATNDNTDPPVDDTSSTTDTTSTDNTDDTTDTSADSSSPEDTATDYSMDDGNTDDTTATDSTDTTSDSTDTSADDSATSDDTSTDYSMDDTSGDSSSTDSATTDDTSTEELSPDDGMKKIEDEMNKGLTDKEIDLRNKQLKTKYVEVYEIVKNINNRMESVPKTEENMPVIDFINDKILELKQLIYDYLNTTYDTQTYIKNYTNHQEYLTVLAGIKKLFDEIKPKTKDDKRK